MLLACEEPKEMGLGHSLGTKRGSAVGPKLAGDIIAVLVSDKREANLNP